jgi:hypothetical protein
MSFRMAVVAAAAIGAAVLSGAVPPAATFEGAASVRPVECRYHPDAERNAGLVAGEPRAGLLYLASRGRFHGYRCPDGTAGIVYVPVAGAR